MSKLCVYVKMHDYLGQWCVKHYGNPVRFPACSPENAAIRVLLARKPKNGMPNIAGEGRVAFEIPDSKDKPAWMFNHLTEAGEKAMRDMVSNIFKVQLWNDLFPMLDPSDGKNISHMPILTVIRDWCEKNGIDQDYDYTIKMKWQRMREAHPFPMKVRTSTKRKRTLAISR